MSDCGSEFDHPPLMSSTGPVSPVTVSLVKFVVEMGQARHLPDIADGLAERTLVRLAHEGKIPGVKIGGQWRFRRALLLDGFGLAPQPPGPGQAAPVETQQPASARHQEDV